jgi:hypothetical protein
MVFDYPKEYWFLYELFKNGSTIREWVNKVEALSKDVVIADPVVNCTLLKQKLSDQWDVSFNLGENIFIVYKSNMDKVSINIIDMLESIGYWDQESYTWKIKPKSLEFFLYRDAINKFKGDMLEVFSEMFFNIFGADEGVGVTEYTPGDIGSDFGVDATGINVNGHNCVIQVKYRHNPLDVISYADIARTFTSAALQLHLKDVIEHDHTVYLFTTANGVSVAFEKVMGRKCVLVTRDVISTKVDNNKAFWRKCYEMMYYTLNK